MIPRLLAILVFVLSGLTSVRAGTEDFEFGPRPANSIFDPLGVLDSGALGKITGPMQKLREKEGIDIVVVVLDDLKGAPPEHVAGRFAAAWSGSLIRAVILHVPGNPDSPWIVPGGELTDLLHPEAIAKDTSRGKRLASYEPTEAGKVRVAVEEASDRLRYWKATHFNATEARKKAIAKIRLEHDDKSRQWRIIMLTCVACAIPLIIGCYMLYLMLRKPGSRYFPEVVPPRRMGAPHAGGNQAVTKLGPPQS